MIKTLSIAATMVLIAAPALGQAVAPPKSGAASNPSATMQPESPGRSDQAPGREFKSLDSDSNGSISEEEYGSSSSKPFADADRNKDGRISRDEYAKLPDGMKQGNDRM